MKINIYRIYQYSIDKMEINGLNFKWVNVHRLYCHSDE